MGAHESWSNTIDRTARTQPARSAGPGSIDYWVAKLDPEKFAGATDQQRLDAAESLRKAFYARLAYRSAQARRSKAAAPPDAG
jgi:hypothetical protein